MSSSSSSSAAGSVRVCAGRSVLGERSVVCLGGAQTREITVDLSSKGAGKGWVLR